MTERSAWPCPYCGAKRVHRDLSGEGEGGGLGQVVRDKRESGPQMCAVCGSRWVFSPTHRPFPRRG